MCIVFDWEKVHFCVWCLRYHYIMCRHNHYLSCRTALSVCLMSACVCLCVRMWVSMVDGGVQLWKAFVTSASTIMITPTTHPISFLSCSHIPIDGLKNHWIGTRIQTPNVSMRQSLVNDKMYLCVGVMITMQRNTDAASLDGKCVCETCRCY